MTLAHPVANESELARKSYTIFWRQMWRDSPTGKKTWEELEPWERQAWVLVVRFLSTNEPSTQQSTSGQKENHE